MIMTMTEAAPLSYLLAADAFGPCTPLSFLALSIWFGVICLLQGAENVDET